MALDATVAGAAADSYLDLEGADAYAAADLGRDAEAWRKATVEAKEAALRRAAYDIDDYVGTVPALLRATQLRLFPRSTDVDDSDEPFVPAGVLRAAYLQAAYVLRNAEVIDDAATRRAQGLQSFANPDGTGGTVADNYTGNISPRARVLLDRLTQGAVIARIVTT